MSGHIKAKGVKGGTNRGDLIEMSPAEKTQEAIGVAANSHPEFEGCLVWVSDFKLGNLDKYALGDPLKQRYSNYEYKADGEATFNRRRVANDTILQPVRRKFQIVFKDIVDDNGLPELDVSSFVTE
jgi:hypothetical protein